MEKLYVSSVSEIKKYFPNNSYIITDSTVKRLYPELFSIRNIAVKPGEFSKCFSSVETIVKKMVSAGAGRDTVIVAVGGGLVGDLAGFTASVYMRGVKWINVPTTLLAFADSSVGGKTGINVGNIKNLVGSFYEPELVIYCPSFLDTLGEKEFMSGAGEIIKTALLYRPLYEKILRTGLTGESAAELAYDAASFKQTVTGRDFREESERKILNAGHTVGHALETLDNYRLAHGQYILLGLKAELSAFPENNPYYGEMSELVEKYVPADFVLPPLADAIRIMLSDKKNRGDLNKNISVLIPNFDGAVEHLSSPEELMCRLEKIWK